MATIDLSEKRNAAIMTKFSLYEYYGSQSSFEYHDNINFTYNGRTYEDTVFIGDDNDYNKLRIGGTGLTVDTAHNLTGGTITGIVEQHVVDPAYTKGVFQDLSLSATKFWSVVKSTGNADDIAMLKGMLAGNDTVTMTQYGDVVQAMGGNDVVHGLGGNDVLYGGTGNDTLYGDGGNDTLVGEAGTNTLDGGDGVDTATYSTANAAVSVNMANGTVTGTGIADTLINIEIVTGTAYADTMIGSAKNDILRAGAGNDMLNGGAGDDKLDGNAGNDQLLGMSGVDRLNGNSGDDVLRGGDGKDILNGGSGNDKLYGDNNQDTLTGDTGADTFVFGTNTTSANHTLSDRITDFSHVDGDRIDLAAIDANSTVTGNQAFTFIGSAAFTAAGQLHAVIDAGVTWVEGDVNGDHLADFAIRLDGAPTLLAADFLL